MDWDDEDEDVFFSGGGGLSFAALGRKEAESTGASLLALEARLYKAGVELGGEGEEEEEVGPAVDEFRRFESMGYEAHTDCVEESEIKSWRRKFHYLRIEGKAASINSLSSSSSTSSSSLEHGILGEEFERDSGLFSLKSTSEKKIENEKEQCSVPSPPFSKDDSFLSLVVTGQRVVLHTSLLEVGKEGEEEVILSEGVLEEIIDINCSSSSAKKGNNDESKDTQKQQYLHSPPVSPVACRRDEAITVLLEAVWPDCVDALAPLVSRLVAAAREANITYQKEADISESGRAEAGSRESW